jgi:hypothetical protein
MVLALLLASTRSARKIGVMPVPESVVASVVADTSTRMKDPQFTQIAVGHFVETQGEIARFLSARAARIGGAQGVLEAAFHAELLCECLRRHSGRTSLRAVDLRTLDHATKGDPVAAFSAREPALASYVASNVEAEVLRGELCRIGLALVLSQR